MLAECVCHAMRHNNKGGDGAWVSSCKRVEEFLSSFFCCGLVSDQGKSAPHSI